MTLGKIPIAAAGLAAFGGAGLYLFVQYVNWDQTEISLLPPQGAPKAQAAPEDWNTMNACIDPAESAQVKPLI